MKCEKNKTIHFSDLIRLVYRAGTEDTVKSPINTVHIQYVYVLTLHCTVSIVCYYNYSTSQIFYSILKDWLFATVQRVNNTYGIRSTRPKYMMHVHTIAFSFLKVT